jgi:hypothetical protein
VPASLIEHQDGVLVIAERGGEAIEELPHRRCVDVRHDEREGIVRTWLHGREDVGEGEALVGETGRVLAPSPPDVAGAPFLADAGLILEEEADTLVFMRMLKFSQQRRGSF